MLPKKQHCCAWHLLGKAAKCGDVAGASFVVDVTDHAEEEPHHETVSNHLADCTRKAHEVQSGYT